MGGFLEPSPLAEKPESNLRPILFGVALVIVVIGIAVFFLRSQPKSASGPPPYAANVKLSDLKMSAAENFVGASVSYLDGTVTNAGDKTLIHAVLRVTFKDSLGQVVQTEDTPLHVFETVGPYTDAVDLSSAPLPPGKSKPFRLTFEHISNDWNHEYPEVEVVDVSTK
ncbi:MAG TPA: DUF2393 family protein [Terriglobales bacterium]